MQKQSKFKNLIIIVFLLLFGVIWLVNNLSKTENLVQNLSNEEIEKEITKEDISDLSLDTEITTVETESDIIDSEESVEILSIDQLTKEKTVVEYVKKHGQLPDYYITKEEARKLGWQSTSSDLCKVAPNKAIGGDYFGNFEGNLPKKKGRKYYEADINYKCGKRNAERLVFSNDGLIFVTKNHYKTFDER